MNEEELDIYFIPSNYEKKIRKFDFNERKFAETIVLYRNHSSQYLYDTVCSSAKGNFGGCFWTCIDTYIFHWN